MKRLILYLSEGAVLWLKGYAAAQKISVSRTVLTLCMEQRARFAEASRERHARFILESERLNRRDSLDPPSLPASSTSSADKSAGKPPSPIMGEGIDF